MLLDGGPTRSSCLVAAKSGRIRTGIVPKLKRRIVSGIVGRRVDDSIFCSRNRKIFLRGSTRSGPHTVNPNGRVPDYPLRRIGLNPCEQKELALI